MTGVQAQVPLTSGEQVVAARQIVRRWAVDLGFSLVEQTKLVTATSELARNVIQHGGGGHMTLEVVSEGARRGLRLTFEDEGPGIPDVDLAMKQGYTTGGGLGLGLPGSKRLCDDFSIHSRVGQGTRVVATRWTPVRTS
jgi:serine/threonine-protein kinase RsbT